MLNLAVSFIDSSEYVIGYCKQNAKPVLHTADSVTLQPRYVFICFWIHKLFWIPQVLLQIPEFWLLLEHF